MPREQRPNSRRTETSLYGPVKRYLETLGFRVKGEVCGCDLVALRGEEPPMVVIGELKLSFSLDLVLQAVDRTAACDDVWLAVGTAARGRLRDPRVRKLCRLLGFGLLGVSPSGAVEVLVEPKPWRPRRDSRRRARLVIEHRLRIGDPAVGGSTRQPIMTAYRQQALACAASLAEGPRRTSELRSIVPNAASILLRNFYGWFIRIERGVYKLTSEGSMALARWDQRSGLQTRLPSYQSKIRAGLWAGWLCLPAMPASSDGAIFSQSDIFGPPLHGAGVFGGTPARPPGSFSSTSFLALRAALR